MREPMNCKEVLEAIKSDTRWGKARTSMPCREGNGLLVHLKVARWAECNFNTLPYFIKVISTSSSPCSQHKGILQGRKLAIPRDFTREHLQKLDKVIVLEDAVNGSTWTVSYQVSQGYKYWSRGWPAFAQHNNLLSGNIVVFALVAHSRFSFTLFNNQGCQIIHPTRVKKDIHDSSAEKQGVKRSRQWRSASSPKHFSRRVEPKLKSQEDEENSSHDLKHSDDFAAQNLGHDKECLLRVSLRQPKRISGADLDNHHICVQIGFSCGVHHHQEKPKIQLVNRIFDQSEDSNLLCECQNGLGQIQIAECMDTNQPLEEDRALSEKMSEETLCREVERLLVHPKVARWAEEYNHNTPYFIKVICKSSSYYSQHKATKGAKITVPKHFTRKNFQKLDRDVTLEDAVNGSSWKVSYQVSQGYKIWSRGWSAFAQQNNLLQGNIIVFALVSHSRFLFTLFNEQGCQIIQPFGAKQEIQPVNQTLDQSEDEHFIDECRKELEQIQIAECMDTNQPLGVERAFSEEKTSEDNSESGNTCEGLDNQLLKLPHLDPIWFTFVSKRRVVTDEERQEAKHAGSRYRRILRRPNSITVMKESHVYKEFIMELPKSFVSLGGDIVFPQPALTLVDSTGRSWEMQWYASGRHHLALVPKDWALFSVHHFLEEGDACVFEATHIEALTILVRIFRVVDVPRNHGADDIYIHYSVESAF